MLSRIFATLRAHEISDIRHFTISTEDARDLVDVIKAASDLVWTKDENGSVRLADWHENEVPATRLRQMLEEVCRP